MTDRPPWCQPPLVWALALALLAASCGKDPRQRAEDDFYKGKAALARGDVVGAVALLERAVRREPGRIDARVALVRALLRHGKLKRAHKVVVAGIERRPKSAALWQALGQVERRRGRYSPAVAAFSRALKLDPRLAQASFGLGDIYEGYGKLDVARSHYRAVLVGGRNPAHAWEARRRLAKIARKQRRFREGIAHLRAALRLAPQRPVLYGELGQLLRDAGRPNAALKPLRTWVRLAPARAEAHLALGLTLHALARHAEAVRSLEVAVKRLPRNGAGVKALAESLIAQGKRDEAYAWGVKALALSPGDAGLQWLMAPLYVRRGLHAAAEELLDKLRGVRAHDPEYWKLASRVAGALQQWKRSREYAAKALVLKPRDAAVIRMVAFAARRAGDYLGADLYLNELVKLKKPPDYELLINLGIVHEQLGRRAASKRALDAAARRDPKRPEAFTYLAWLALRSRNGKLARELARRADRVAGGKSAHALDVWAQAEVLLGERAAAAKVLDRALLLPGLSKGDRSYFGGKLAEIQPKVK